MNPEIESYKLALNQRRRGVVSDAGPATAFYDLKPEFYADSRLLSEAVLKKLRQISNDSPPLGLVGLKGTPVASLEQPGRNRWLVLESGLSSTIRVAYDTTQPPTESCPYHEVLSAKLGRRALVAIDHDQAGLDTLREVSAPGGLAAPALVVNLLRRMPAIAAVHQASSSVEDLARNSSGLLRAPLAHAQQHAKAFMYCLTGEEDSIGFSFDRERFLPNELISRYMRLEHSKSGQERVAWAMPTADFIVRASLDIPSRVSGSELNMEGEHIISYPNGTRLGDIKVDEPTLGCPGSPVAYWLWGRSIDIAVAEDLWTA